MLSSGENYFRNMNSSVELAHAAIELPERDQVHWKRKVWHILTGSMALMGYYWSGLGPKVWALIALAIAIAGFSIDYIRLKRPTLNRWFMQLGGHFYRESEKTGFSGLPFYALGVAISLFLFPEKSAVLSVFFLVFSDPISSYFGVLYGQNKILPNKSIQGSFAGFVTCYLITLAYGLVYSDPSISLLGFAILGGIIGSFSELCSFLGIDDNLTIPVISGFGLTLLNILFLIY